jgi:hypothetical protein
MSSSSAIGDVTRTLEEMLVSEQRPLGLFDVSHISPADEDPTKLLKPSVNIFLFRVVEDAFARNQDWEPVGVADLRYPPLALDLFYVITPFAKEKIDEHAVLGEAMRVFYNNAVIPVSLLKGSLENSSVELKLDLLQTSFEDLARIWSALAKPYRLSVCYQVRMVLIESQVERTTHRVLEKIDRVLIR